MEHKKLQKIPPQYFGHRKNLRVVIKLKQLELRESIELPLSARGTVHSCAKIIGIKVVTRQLGSKNKVTIWRIE